MGRMSTPAATPPQPADAPHSAARSADPSARALGEMPIDELRAYAENLGLQVPAGCSRGDLVLRVSRRLELIERLDRDALLDICVWAHRPVRQSDPRPDLVRAIAAIEGGNYSRLSARGLRALAALRSVPVGPNDTDAMVADALVRAEGLRQRLSRVRRALVGAVLSRVIEGDAAPAEYQFLPEDDAARRLSLKHEIEDRGVVGGIASRLRGAADDYLRSKLDEIEARIDRKLDEIDRRLSEWRDREVANRLRILRITLVASVLFALLSLGYHVVVRRWMGAQPPPPIAATPPDTPR